MSMVGFPLLLIPLAVYNIIAFLMPSVSLGEPLFSLPLVSGAEWPVTLSDILLTLGIILLLLELIKGARPGAKYLIDHLLSLIVCAAAIAEFLLWPRFANSTFFLLTLLILTEFFSGIALRTRRAVPATFSNGRRSTVAVQPVQPMQESRARQDAEVPTAPPPAPVAAHGEPHAEPQVEPVEHHDPVPVLLEKETVPPSAEASLPPSQPDEDLPRPPETPHRA